MNTILISNVAALQAATHKMSLTAIQGHYAGTADAWLQIHDSNTTPAESAVPKVHGFKLYADTPFLVEFGCGALELVNGLYICVSSTQNTKTLSVVSDQKLSGHIETEQPESPSGVTVVGDKTTAVAALEVWEDSAGPNVLYQVEVKNNGATTSYAQIFAKDAPETGNYPWNGHSHPVSAGATLMLAFGGGARVSAIEDGTEYNGCRVAMSTTHGTFTADAASFTIRAEYKSN